MELLLVLHVTCSWTSLPCYSLVQNLLDSKERKDRKLEFLKTLLLFKFGSILVFIQECQILIFVGRVMGLNHDAFQFSIVTQSCPTLCDPMNHSMPGLPVHHQIPEFTQTHAHRVSDTIQPSHPLSSPSPPALNLSQHQSLFKWVSSSHQVAKVLQFQLQHHSFQWTPRTDLL